jgi:hypothetical protein
MGRLAAFLSTVLLGFITSLTKRVGINMAVAAVYIGAYVALLTSLYVILKGIILSFSLLLSNEYLVMGFWLLWPGNAEIVISAMLSTDILLFIYRIHATYLFTLRNSLQRAG